MFTQKKTKEIAPAYQDNEHSGEVSRRTVLKVFKAIGYTAAAVCAGARYDQMIGDRLRSQNPTEFVVRKTMEDMSHVREQGVTFVFPGFNSNPYYLADNLEPSMLPYGDMVTVDYGEDLYPDVLAEKIAKYLRDNYGDDAEEYPSIIAVGHSMGGIISIETMGILRNKYNIRLSALILDSAPTSIDDVKGSKVLSVRILAAADKMKYHGGPISRAIIETFSRFLDGNKNPIENFTYGFERAVPKDGAKENDVVERQASILLNAESELPRAMEQIGIVPTLYAGAQNGVLDAVVYTMQASTHWKSSFAQGAVSTVEIENGEHGIDKDTKEEYATFIKDFIARKTAIKTIAERNKQVLDDSFTFRDDTLVA